MNIESIKSHLKMYGLQSLPHKMALLSKVAYDYTMTDKIMEVI